MLFLPHTLCSYFLFFSKLLAQDFCTMVYMQCDILINIHNQLISKIPQYSI